MYAISGVESELRFYKIDTESGDVSYFTELDEPWGENTGEEKAAREHWETDILSDDGYRRVMAIVACLGEMGMDARSW